MSEIIFNSPPVENFQTTLASLNQRLIILQESLQEKDREIADLKARQQPVLTESTVDNSLTIVGLCINLYKFIFLSGRAA